MFQLFEKQNRRLGNQMCINIRQAHASHLLTFVLL